MQRSKFPCPTCGKSFLGMGGHVRKCYSTPAARFWAKVDKNGPGGCWLYMGYRKRHDYGWLHTEHGLMTGHRYAWLLTHGSLPTDKYVLHKCDVGACCNPDHLWLGTQADNNRDMWAKGRAGCLGEKNMHAKLTEADVRAIRRDYQPRKNALELAKKYGVTRNSITEIANGNRWSHLR